MAQHPYKRAAFFTGLTSTLLVVSGTALLIAIFWPYAAQMVSAPQATYQPQLPLADDRTPFSYLSKEEIRRSYPPLHSEDVPVEEGNWIRIPSIGVSVPLVLSPTMDDADVLTTLNQGAALYPNGILPGRLGNVFIAAHSTGEPWKGKYRFAFLRINEVDSGALIHLDWEGTRYTYRVASSEIVTPGPDVFIPSDRPVPSVTLMACWPIWTTDKRMLLRAELTNVTLLTDAAS